METTPIDIKSLSVSYDRKRVLTNIFLEINAGSLIGVIGPNGAGKSYLFSHVLFRQKEPKALSKFKALCKPAAALTAQKLLPQSVSIPAFQENTCYVLG